MRLHFFALILLSSSLSAQVQWFTPDANWENYIYIVWGGDGIEHISVTTDTIQFDGKVYQVLSRTLTNPGGFHEPLKYVRQEGSRIYAMRSFAFSGNYMPFLMYDFDLVVGDVVMIPSYSPFSPGFGYVIESTDSLIINGVQLRRQTVSWSYNNQSSNGTKSTFVEGIGNVQGFSNTFSWASHLFLDEPPTAFVDGTDRWFCSYTNSNGRFEGQSMPACASLNVQDAPLRSFQVNPNPTSGVVHVSGYDSENRRYRLHDLNGRLIEEGWVKNQIIETKHNGFCILQVYHDLGIASFKLLVLP